MDGVRVWRGEHADESRVHNAACGGGLSCRGTDIGEEGAWALAAALRESALTSLNLGCVRIVCARVILCVKNAGRGRGGWGVCVRGEGTARMSHVFAQCTRGGPSCRFNGIGDAGAQAIADALRESSLTSLNLGCVRIVCARVISCAKNEGRDGACVCVW